MEEEQPIKQPLKIGKDNKLSLSDKLFKAYPLPHTTINYENISGKLVISDLTIRLSNIAQWQTLQPLFFNKLLPLAQPPDTEEVVKELKKLERERKEKNERLYG